MKRFDIRLLITIAILVIFAGLHLFYTSQASRPVGESINIFDLPMQIGEWSAEDIKVEDKIKDILETESVLMRRYTNAQGDNVVLTIVYYNDNRVEFHLPERCSVGQGSDVIASKIDYAALNNGEQLPYKLLTVDNYSGSQLLAYFFQSEDYFTYDYIKLKFRMILNKLLGRPNSGTLIKCAVSSNYDQQKSKLILDTFINDLTFCLRRCLTHKAGR